MAQAADAVIACLIPVLNRPARVEPLIESFNASLGSTSVRLLFICSPDDFGEQIQLRNHGHEPLVVHWPPGHADYALKIQAGYEATSEPWIFTGADDLAFHPGWAEEALAVAENTRKRVIGTADLGNPEVKRGKTATHLLIARSYVEEWGTIDQPGQVFSLAYSHNWVDREAVQTARARDEWAFAPRSIVEHLHFHWGKGVTDSTYRKGLRNFGQDRRLFHQRMRKAGMLA